MKRKRRMKRKIGLALAAAISLIAGFPALAGESEVDVICAPSGMAAAEDGSILVTDVYHKVVWKVKDQKSEIYAGAVGVSGLYGEPQGGYFDSAREESLFKEPWAVAPFLEGYAVSDSGNNVVRLIYADAAKTAVGSSLSGAADGRGTNASFSNPTGLAADPEGNLYIADTNNNCIRKVTKDGLVSTYAAGLSEPTGLCFQNGVLYAADSANHRIVKIIGGEVSLVAGGGGGGYADGTAGSALFFNPQGIAVSGDGVIYVADTGNSAIRRIEGDSVTTLMINSGSLEEMYPVSPRGLLLVGNTLYVSDPFARLIFSLPVG